jgi:hypothetical protein
MKRPVIFGLPGAFRCRLRDVSPASVSSLRESTRGWSCAPPAAGARSPRMRSVRLPPAPRAPAQSGDRSAAAGSGEHRRTRYTVRRVMRGWAPGRWRASQTRGGHNFRCDGGHRLGAERRIWLRVVYRVRLPAPRPPDCPGDARREVHRALLFFCAVTGRSRVRAAARHTQVELRSACGGCSLTQMRLAARALLFSSRHLPPGPGGPFSNRCVANRLRRKRMRFL